MQSYKNFPTPPNPHFAVTATHAAPGSQCRQVAHTKEGRQSAPLHSRDKVGHTDIIFGFASFHNHLHDLAAGLDDIYAAGECDLGLRSADTAIHNASVCG